LTENTNLIFKAKKSETKIEVEEEKVEDLEEESDSSSEGDEIGIDDMFKK